VAKAQRAPSAAWLSDKLAKGARTGTKTDRHFDWMKWTTIQPASR